MKPSSAELASLATMLAILRKLSNGNAPVGDKAKPNEFFKEALDLVQEADQFFHGTSVAELFNAIPFARRRANSSAPLDEASNTAEQNKIEHPIPWCKEWKFLQRNPIQCPNEPRYSFAQIVKPQPRPRPDDKELLKWMRQRRTRLRNGNPYSGIIFNAEDLANRPGNLTMVGHITTQNGLKKAIRRFFPSEAEELIKARSLTLFHINQILCDSIVQGKVVKFENEPPV